MIGWLVVRTQNQREAWACENIMRQVSLRMVADAELYVPRIVERVKLGRKRQVQVERAKFLFPSYVFVKTSGQWRFLLGTFGVAGVVMQGSQPASMQDKVVEDLRSREDVNGLVVLPQRPGRLERGKEVRVSSGPYSGYKGIYDGSAPHERERILLDYLGRKTVVLIGSTQVESM